ncbi:MAG: DUF3857 domain-containing protein [candidate division Zixibacteria bacterium]|nr:DUF3857 domain-containing protein [candidate division Zixibacteria bacterium]
MSNRAGKFYPGPLFERITMIKVLAWMLLISLVCCAGIGADSGNDEEAYYDYCEWDYKVTSKGYTLVFRAKVTITGRRGNSYNTIYIGENKFVKLKSAKVRVLDANGKEIYSQKKKDFIKQCGYGQYSVYNDLCYYILEGNSASYPYSIEYEYTLRSSSLFFLTGRTFQKAIPVRRAFLQLETTPDVTFTYRCDAENIMPMRSRTADGNIITYWEKIDLPKFEETDYVPEGIQKPIGIRLRFNSIELDSYKLYPSSWSGIGQWYYELAQDKYLCIEAITLDRYFSLKERIKNIYDAVSRDVRYVGVQIGIGGWQPYEANQTLKRKYGDCKDMTTLLISQLAKIGVKAYPCLIMTRGSGLTDPEYPDYSFNHVITMAVLGKDTLWMDPTPGNCQFGDLPSGDEDNYTVVVSQNGGRLIKTPASLPSDNIMTRMAEIKINSHLAYEIKSTITATGNQERYLKGRFDGLRRSDVAIAVQAYYPGEGGDFEIISSKILRADKTYLPIEVSITAQALRSFDKIGKKVYVPLLPFCRLTDLEETELDGREYPLNLVYPQIDKDSIIFSWDTSLVIDSIVLPDDEFHEYPFGDIRLTCQRQDYSVTVIFEKTRKQYALQPEQFAEFENYRNQLKALYKKYMKLFVSN